MTSRSGQHHHPLSRWWWWRWRWWNEGTATAAAAAATTNDAAKKNEEKARQRVPTVDLCDRYYGDHQWFRTVPKHVADTVKFVGDVGVGERNDLQNPRLPRPVLVGRTVELPGS